MNIFNTETTALFRKLIPNRNRRWLAVAGFWSAISWLSAIHWEFFSPPPDPWTWWGLVLIKHVVWFTWGFLATPVILWLAHRFRPQYINWPKNISLLLACSILITAAYVTIYAWLLTMNIQIPRLAHFDQMLRFSLFQHSTYYFLAFWGTVGLEQGLWYYRRWHEREMQASELRSQLALAQLRALRAQIQPHFLFNALNTVSSAILEGESTKAYDLTAKLGELLRLSLERGEHDLVTLAQEIELVERYLDLVKARFGDRLDVCIEISPVTQMHMVPSFVLQPSVENSVKHVLERTSGRVCISLRAFILMERLVLEIEDAGVAMTTAADQMGSSGRGYRLTEERLRILYGDQYLFRVTAGAGGGTLVHLEIPLTNPEAL